MLKISKKVKTVLIACFSVVLFFAVALLGIRLYFRAPVKDYYNASEKAFAIPEIGNGFVPQGFCYDKQKGLFLTSGYYSNDKPSTVHVIEKKSGNAIYSVELLNEDGTPHTGHAGGVAQYKDWVYIAGSSSHCIYVYSYSQILSGEKQVKALGSYSLEVTDDDYLKASFVSVMNNKLIVGEFFSEPSYKTLDTHKITSKNGEELGGIALEYSLSADFEYGIASTPIRAYALPDKVQGLYFDNEKVYLSTSLGFKHSYILEHDCSKLEQGERIEILGQKVDLKIFVSESLAKMYKLPPMSEEIALVQGKLYVMSEFASNKYILGKFTSAKWCYCTDLSKM